MGFFVFLYGDTVYGILENYLNFEEIISISLSHIIYSPHISQISEDSGYACGYFSARASESALTCIHNPFQLLATIFVRYVG